MISIFDPSILGLKQNQGCLKLANSRYVKRALANTLILPKPYQLILKLKENIVVIEIFNV